MTGNFAILAFYSLFALVSTTIFHIEQALTLVLPTATEARELQVKQNMRRYNISVFCVCLVYFVFLLVVFFDPYDVEVQLVLGIDLFFRLVLFFIYSWVVARLYKRL